MAQPGDNRGQGGGAKPVATPLALRAFAVLCFLLVLLVFAALAVALFFLFFGTPPSGLRPALLVAVVVIAVGMLIGALSLLLGFAERERLDRRPPPSLAPALIMVALGVALGCVSALQ